MLLMLTEKRDACYMAQAQKVGAGLGFCKLSVQITTHRLATCFFFLDSKSPTWGRVRNKHFDSTEDRGI